MLLASLASATCAVDLTTLRAHLAAADPVAVQADLPCLTEVVDPADAAALRTLLGPPGEGTTPVPAPSAGDVFFDGQLSVSRPNAGTLLQQRDADGVVVLSTWLTPEMPLPAYVDVHSAKRGGKLGPGAIVLGTSGAAGFLAGGALAVSSLDDCAQGDCAGRNVGLGVMGAGVALLIGGIVAIRARF